MRIIVIIILILICVFFIKKIIGKSSDFYQNKRNSYTYIDNDNPQKIKIGIFKEFSKPFISPDCVFYFKNKNIIHLRPEQSNYLTVNQIEEYVNKQKEPKVLIVTTNIDKSFPDKNHQKLLNNRNISAIITHNPLIIHKKIYPLPIGAKWQFKSTLPFGESKKKMKNEYLKYCASNSSEAYNLFRNNRESKIFLRPMAKSDNITKLYNKFFSIALSTKRQNIIKNLGKLNMVDKFDKKISKKDYLTNLKKYRFVISPQGNGLDSHSTWEALMCGCIPIVPSSPLNPFYKKLPIWIVSDWNEITEESSKLKEIELIKNIKQTDFDLAFYSGIEAYVNNICSAKI